MAELTAPPRGVSAQQMLALAQLRWQLLLNSVRTGRGQLELIARIWTGFWFAVLALGAGVGCAVATVYFFERGVPADTALLFWLLLAFWQLFPLATSAFTEQPDSSYLLRFPLRYRDYLLVRLALSAFDVSTLVCGLGTLGIVIGVALARWTMLPWAIAAGVLFAAFNLLLAQAIFAWLERWLARRRTREILGALFFLAIISANFVGPMGRQWRQHGLAFHPFAPGLAGLPPSLSARMLAPGAAAFASLVGLAIWIAVVFGLLQLRLRAEFRGETLDQSAPAHPVAARPRNAVHPPAPAVAGRQPGWSGGGPALAVAQKELRYLLRSPMMFFSLAMPVVLLVLFRMNGAGMTRRHGSQLSHALAGGFGFPLCCAYALLVLTNLVFNAFGTDANGVQFYFMSPVRFRQVLAGKNLAYAAMVACEIVIIYIAAALLDGPPPAWIVAATLIGITFAAMCDFAAGNLLSLNMPKAIDLSRLGRQGGRGVSNFVALGIQAVVVGLAAIAVLAGVLLHRHWLALVLLALLLVAAAATYRLLLERTDALALARREVLITELSKTAKS